MTSSAPSRRRAMPARRRSIRPANTAASPPPAADAAPLRRCCRCGRISGEQGEAAMRSHHDMGGLPAGPVERKEHDYALWEKRVDALMVLLSAPQRRLLRVDELHRNIEALPPDAYERMTYYERWISSIANTLLQRGVFTAEELGGKMAEVAARGAAP